jgi:hypothetical protein
MVSNRTDPVNPPHRPALLWVLVGLLTVEFLLVAALTVLTVVSLVEGGAGSLASGIALTVIVALAAIWLAAMVIGALRGQAWIRAAAVVWQVIQIAVGIGALLGALSQPWIGWPLVIVGVAAFVLLFTPSVVAATRRRDDTAV